MTPNPAGVQSSDVVGLFVFLAASFFSNEVAAFVGPYIVIVIAAAIGASFALSRRKKSTRLSAVGFFLRIIGLAILGTVAVAGIIIGYRPALEERFLIAPVALMIGFIGDDWPALLRGIMRSIFALVDFTKGKLKEKPEGQSDE